MSRTNTHLLPHKGHILLLTSVLLAAGLLGCLLFQENVHITGSRSSGGYVTLNGGAPEELSRESAPLGIVEVYEPELPELTGAGSSLVFYVRNQYVTVTIDGEVVYALNPGEGRMPILATGGHWVRIPLESSDAGRSIRVEITPVYRSLRGRQVEFLLGSSRDIFNDLFLKALPELLLCLILILLGLSMLVIALFWRKRWQDIQDLLSLSLSGIAVALWRLADSRFLTFAFPGPSILLYYISLLSLGFTVCFLAWFLYSRLSAADAWLRSLCSGLGIISCLTICVQILLQFTGLLDLRQTLRLTHILLAACIVLLFITLLRALTGSREEAGARAGWRFIGLLPLGLGADLLLYYVRRDSASLLFTILALVLLISARGVMYLRRAAEQEAAISETELQLKQSRITLTLSQIRSHFVFNILNAISGMCKYDPEQADRTVVAFARYLRTNIDIMQNDNPVPFLTALEHVEDYVALEQIRFGYSIHFQTDLEVVHFQLPPLLIQPLVENAIRHGLLPKPEGGTVTLRTRQEEGFFRVDIVDDGVGFDPACSGTDQSVGMQNVRFRLEHMIGGHMTVTSQPGSGTTVSLYIPREENEA